MQKKIIQGNEKLASRIRSRRQELKLTIEEAASRAGVGTKSWCRYEAGESIREDKVKGICKALNWQCLREDDEDKVSVSPDDYRNHEAWSKYLENLYGPKAAMAFAIGSDLLWDRINEDLNGLSAMPKGTHLGQLEFSWLKDDLPEQFLVNYDYDFLYRMKCELKMLRSRAHNGFPMIAHSVIEEFLIYLCNAEMSSFYEVIDKTGSEEEVEGSDDSDWVFDLLGDEDLLWCLYSNNYLEQNNIYHFVHWGEAQFYMDRP